MNILFKVYAIIFPDGELDEDKRRWTTKPKELR